MIDTNIAAKPTSLSAVSQFFWAGAGALGTWEDASLNASNAAVAAWSGASFASFDQAVIDGINAARALADEFANAAEKVETLLAALQECQDAMAEARETARAGGLVVVAFRIYPPSRNLWAVMQDPEATDDEKRAAASQATAWGTVQDLTYRAQRTWHNAVEKYRDEAVTDRITLQLTGAGFAADSVEGIVDARVKMFSESLDSADDMISTLQRNIDALVVDGKVVGGSKFFYELVDERDLLKLKRGSLVDALDTTKRLGSKVAKASVILGIAGYGYGTYTDIQDGESVTQALVSNGVDWGVAAAFTAGGAALGSFVVPPIGTVVGGVIGGIVGVFAGGFGNAVTDYLFEDLSPDVGGAISAGWDEVENLGESIGDLASSAWNSIF